MLPSPGRFTLPLTFFAAACLVALSPLMAVAGDDPQRPVQPPAGRGAVVVEQVENGPVFGLEFKYTEINREDAFLLGGYAGVIFDNRLLIGGAGYWQVDTGYYGHDDYYSGYDDYYGYDGYYDNGPYGRLNGYGGLLLEWYALRSPAVALSVRGLVGGGIARVGWSDYVGVPESSTRHGSGGGNYGYYAYDQGYFVFEPQVNVTVRVSRGIAMVGGVGYRVIAAANGWEDQIQGLTGTFAIRFGGGK